jgi:excisionase family DNA binding protein
VTHHRHDVPPNRRGFVDALASDEHAAAAALLSAVQRGRFSPEEALLQVVAPAAAEVGERWARHEWDVPTEHAVSLAIDNAVAAVLQSHASTRERGRIVATVPEGEAHTLPARIFSAALALRGWRVTLLVPPVAPAELTAYLARTAPAALLLTCTTRACLPQVPDTVAAAHAAGVPVVAGGAAFGTSPRRAAALGADAWASSLDGAEHLLSTPRRPRRGGCPGAAQPFAVVDAVVVQAWAATLRGDDDPVRAEWFAGYAPLVLRSMRAALLTDDDDVLVEDLTWLAAATAARFRDDDLGPLLAPLRRVLPVTEVRAHGLLAAAAQRLEEIRDTGPAPRRARVPGRPFTRTPIGRVPAYDDLAFVASVTCDASIGLVVVGDGDRMVVKGAYGVDARDYDDNGEWAVGAFVDDARATPDLALHPVVVRHGVAFLGQAPIRDADGNVTGAVVVADAEPKATGWSQRQAVRSLARQVAARPALGVAAMPLVIVDGDELGAVPPDVRDRIGHAADADDLLRTSQVANLFRVSPRTVNNWVAQGRLPAIATAGGHKRYRLRDVLALYREQASAAEES